jgi:hypothetical protein
MSFEQDMKDAYERQLGRASLGLAISMLCGAMPRGVRIPIDRLREHGINRDAAQYRLWLEHWKLRESSANARSVVFAPARPRSLAMPRQENRRTVRQHR